jgi:transposase
MQKDIKTTSENSIKSASFLSLEDEIAALRSRCAELECKNKSLKQTNQDLEHRNKSLDQKRQNLEQTNQDLEHRNKSLDQKRQNLEQDNQNLEHRNKSLEQMAHNLESMARCLEQDNQDLKQSNQTLSQANKSLEQKTRELENRLAYFLKKFNGRMSEKRYLPIDPNQLSLFTDEELAQMSPEESEAIATEAKQEEEVVERTIKVKKHPKRKSLDTTNLPVSELHIWPDGVTDESGNLLEGYIEIGTEYSDRLEMLPAALYISRIIRHKVISASDSEKHPEERNIMIAPMPVMPIDKGMAGATILTELIIAKFLFHMPFYRQINRFREYGLRLAASTVNDWYENAVEILHPLYKLLRERVMASEYIQVDESVIPILDNEKHKARKGYLWCVRDGLSGMLYFWYDQGSRSKKTACKLLGGYRGTFQSDGYEVYDHFCYTTGVTGAACWAHVRRKFVDALKEDKTLATQAIVMIGKLYKIEAEADEQGLDYEQRREKRQRESYPVILLFEKWCIDNTTQVLQRSLMGKAIAYAYSLLERLSVYINDGRINIDNNLIENAIRPLALGRKNWLFCGNDASACRAAIVYSLIGSCKAADVDPRQWMEYVMSEAPRRKKLGIPIDDLLPMDYAKRIDAKKWNLPDPD